MTTARALCALGAALFLFACQPAEDPIPDEEPSTNEPTPDEATDETEAPVADERPGQDPESQPTTDIADDGTDRYAAYEELYAMDTRTPVPLQPMMAWHQRQNMMEHLVAIQQITEALANEDWDAVAEASSLIESSPQMQMMCEHMGSGAPGFTEMALEFHSRADAIGEAADAQDMQGVLAATSQTLQVCTSCHATYRQDVVDAETWTELTGSTHEPGMGGMHHGGGGH